MTKPYINTDQFMSAGCGFGEVGKNTITVESLSVQQLMSRVGVDPPRATIKKTSAMELQMYPNVVPITRLVRRPGWMINHGIPKLKREGGSRFPRSLYDSIEMIVSR